MARSAQVRHDEDGNAHIDLGWLLKTLIGAGALGALTTLAGIVIGFPSFINRIEATEAEQKKMKAAQHVIAKNQRIIDENVRQLQAESEWTQKKLDVLLTKAGVTERITRPRVERSQLEDAEMPDE
jgi:endonuclease/exonuclease/phosphatase (EEP) superfamily protein YafD